MSLKITKNLEWCTELPSKNCTRQSPDFLLKGIECFFRFCVVKSNLWHYILYIQLKSKLTKSEYCQLQVGFKNEKNLSLDKKAFKLSEVSNIFEIWRIETVTIQPKLPLDYFDGNCIKFLFIFQDVPEHLLEVKNSKVVKEVGDKCLQSGSYLNADVSVESFSEDFLKLLDTGAGHDAEIKCGDQSIKVHKIILGARSEVFSVMFQNNMKEGRTGIVEIQDVDVEYIRDFLRYLYTGKLPELTFDKAKALYEVGDKYAVRSLVIRCSEYLRDNISTENAFQCFELADVYSDEKLNERFIDFILKEKIYLQEELWLPFCESYPKVANEVYRLSYKISTEKKDM